MSGLRASIITDPLRLAFVGAAGTPALADPARTAQARTADAASPAPRDGGLVPLAMLQDALGYGAMSFVLDTASSSVAMAGTQHLTDGNSDRALHGDIARANSGMQGTGVTIGILSDSFNLLGGAAADVAAGNLPGNIRILQEGSNGHDEGRAMADLIHKTAPGAAIMFHTATSGEANFAQGIVALQQAGCQIIVDDVSYLDEPFFQEGNIVQQAVQQVIDAGANYFTSASNEGQNFLQANLTVIRTAIPGLPLIWNVENFGSTAQPAASTSLMVPVNGACSIDLQWDQPFAGIGGSAGSTSSLAMALYSTAGKLVAVAGGLALHKNPEQLLRFTNTTSGTGFRLVLFSNHAALSPSQFKFIVYGNATVNDPRAGQGSGTVTGHELVAGANTVGAEAWSSTPAFGGNGQVEGFSSVGSGQLLFDAAGHRLAQPVDTGKVSFVAPDGSMTSVFAPFYGTSAAAPNAAAVAALVLQADPLLTPAQVTAILKQSAVPAYSAFGGGAVGAGLIQADRAVSLALAMPHHA